MASPLILPYEDSSNSSVNGYDDRNYQEIGTKFLSLIRRGFLTDDPGLGKTIQAIRATELPAMVVAPRYLCGQWEESIRRAHGDAKIAFADGTRKQREVTLKKNADWYIVNLEMLKSYELPGDIRTYINDESHHLRNRNADQSKAAYLVENSDKSARIYNLTATPFWKSVDDIWHQAHILYPSVFTSYHQFVKTYCVTLRTPYGVPKVVRIKRAMKEGLKQLLTPIMLGRTYKDVGRFLPSTIETEIKLDLSPIQRAIYNKLVDSYSLQWDDESERKKLLFQPTTVLHALRQVTAINQKFEAIKGVIEANFITPQQIYTEHI